MHVLYHVTPFDGLCFVAIVFFLIAMIAFLKEWNR